ncbi:MAG TPA: hypothetical protein VH722_21110 [Alphaproteobacteria bacterium]|nr:hypothetical protein [Alphaproteobacteria bacterium]
MTLAVAFASAARAETFITVSDVPVDVTAKDAAAARDQAIAVAQSKAWDKLVKELVTDPAQQARLHPSQQEIESFVQDFGVENERVSTVRYIGLYDVRFRESRVRKYLADSGVTAVASVSADAAQPDQSPNQEQQPQEPGGVTTPYPIAVQVAGVEGWVRLRNQLAGMPGVRHVALDALTREAAALTLDFGGDVVALQAALSNSGYVLVQTAPGNAAGPGMFQLRLAGSAPPQQQFAGPPPMAAQPSPPPQMQ